MAGPSASAPLMLLPGIHMLGNYGFLDHLGKGSNGLVVKALDILSSDFHHQEIVAVKLIPRTSITNHHQTKYLIREVINHAKLAEHPHIICFREVFVTNDYICLAMEYANCGTLLRFLKQRRYLDERLARRFFQQLILAVDYCHQLEIACRDIKCENILLTQPDNTFPPSDDDLLVKLCDFGFSKSAVSQSLMQSSVGTPAYMAPEVLASRGATAYDGKAADIWSCGVTLFVMLYGTLPFAYDIDRMQKHYNTEMPLLHHRMLQQDFHTPKNRQTISDDCYRLLCRLLDPDPRRRITAQQLFSNDWFCEALPPGTAQFNAGVIAANVAPAQPEDHIKAVLQYALPMP